MCSHLLTAVRLAGSVPTMKVLGIMWEQNSTAALLVDGRVIASVSQERFSRIKNDERYPKEAIEYCLREGGVTSQELDAVACIGFEWDPSYMLTGHYSRFSIADCLREQNVYWHPLFYGRKNSVRHYLDVFKDKVDVAQYPGPKMWRQAITFLKKDHRHKRKSARERDAYFQEFRRNTLVKHLGIDPQKITFIDHSTGHAMYAYFASPIRQDALVFTADAWGDGVNASVSVVRGGVFRRIAADSDFRLARLYRYITLILGMKPNEHEYKVMGLAAYAKEKYFQQPLMLFRGMQKVDGLRFKTVKRPTDMYFYFKDKLEGVRFDALAGALQKYAEEIILTWFKNAMNRTGIQNITFAGGVAMNVKANMLINRMPGVKHFFVNPTPDDASQAIGAAMAFLYNDCMLHTRDPRKHIKPLSDAYLGPAIENADIEILLKKHARAGKYRITKKARYPYVAGLLARGKVIGRASGRSEFGARSLGNRSIIADPRNADVVAIINEKVKNRDFWMPFAPSILEHRATDYLIGYKKGGAPYMTIGFETTARGAKDLRAGLHSADKTCRPQVIPLGQNPAYESLISAFEKLTGVGGVLNTSFNLHGEPIVQTAADALRVFELSDLDALLLNDTLIEKK